MTDSPRSMPRAGHHAVSFRFSAPGPPLATSCTATGGWRQVEALRAAASSAAAFDRLLLRELWLVVDDPATTYPTLDSVWRSFQASIDAAQVHLWQHVAG